MRVRTSGSELEINLDLVFCRIYFMRFIPRLVIFTKVSPLSSFIYKKIRMSGKSETQKIQILKNKKYRKNHEQVMAHEFSSSQSCGSVSSYYYDKFLWVTLMIYFYEKFPGSIKLQINSLKLVYKDDQSHFIHREKWRVLIFMESIKMNWIYRITNSIAQTELQSKDWSSIGKWRPTRYMVLSALI